MIIIVPLLVIFLTPFSTHNHPIVSHCISNLSSKHWNHVSTPWNTTTVLVVSSIGEKGVNKFLRPFAALLTFSSLNEATPLFLTLYLLNEGGQHNIPNHLLMFGGGFLNHSTLYSCLEEVFSVIQPSAHVWRRFYILMPFHQLSSSVIFLCHTCLCLVYQNR